MFAITKCGHTLDAAEPDSVGSGPVCSSRFCQKNEWKIKTAVASGLSLDLEPLTLNVSDIYDCASRRLRRRQRVRKSRLGGVGRTDFLKDEYFTVVPTRTSLALSLSLGAQQPDPEYLEDLVSKGSLLQWQVRGVLLQMASSVFAFRGLHRYVKLVFRSFAVFCLFCLFCSFKEKSAQTGKSPGVWPA